MGHFGYNKPVYVESHRLNGFMDGRKCSWVSLRKDRFGNGVWVWG